MERTEFIQALRDAADFLEQRPELPAPDTVNGDLGGHFNLTYYGDCGSFDVRTKEGLATFARICGGRIEKNADDYSFELVCEQNGFSLKAFTSDRDAICERVQIGVKVEPERVIPARAEEVNPRARSAGL